MAGTIIADYIRTDANKLSLNVGNTTIASINVMGLLNSTGGVILNANGTFASGVTFPASGITGTITNSQISTAANTVPRTSVTSGAVLQVVSTNYTTDSTYLSATPASVVSATITPTTATSKILVLYNFNSLFKNGNAEGQYYIYLNGSSLAFVDGIALYDGTSGYHSAGSVSGSYLHSPASTSAQTYALYIGSNGAASVRLNTEGGVTTITLMEIAA